MPLTTLAQTYYKTILTFEGFFFLALATQGLFLFLGTVQATGTESLWGYPLICQ